MEPIRLIYLAGPDVFLENGREVLEKKAERVRELGFVPLTPLDKQLEDPAEIFRSNVDMIEMCDAVLADVTPLHGTEPDSGTVFEIGYAAALQKRIITYGNPPGSYKNRVESFLMRYPTEGSHYAPEPFGLKQNLMISIGVSTEVETFDEALRQLQSIYCQN